MEKAYWDDVKLNRDKLFPNRKMTAQDLVKNSERNLTADSHTFQTVNLDDKMKDFIEDEKQFYMQHTFESKEEEEQYIAKVHKRMKEVDCKFTILSPLSIPRLAPS